MFEGLLQPSHLLIILVVGLFVFGPKKLPELGKGLAQGIRQFKDAMNPHDPPPPPAATTTEDADKNKHINV